MRRLRRARRGLRAVLVAAAVLGGGVTALWHAAPPPGSAAVGAGLAGIVVESPGALAHGVAPPAEATRHVTVTLHGPRDEGAARAVGSMRLWSGVQRWRVELRDARGALVEPAPGDRVRVRVGALRGELRVPALRLRYERVAGRVLGQAAGVAPAGWTAVLTTSEGIARSDLAADGAFTLSTGAPLLSRTPLTLELIDPSGHRLRLVRHVPWLRVSLRPGDVIGVSAPHALVRVALRDGAGALRGSGLARADAEGRWRAWLRDGSGSRVRPRAGDTVERMDSSGTRRLRVRDPAPTVRDDGAIVGRAPAGWAVTAYVWSPWRPGETESLRTITGPDGRWALHPARHPEAATHAYVTLVSPEGDHLYDCYQQPALHARLGTAVQPVEALYDLRGALSLEREGRALASASVDRRWGGSTALRLREEGGGAAVAAEAGDVLRGHLDERALELMLPQLEAQLADAPMRLVGRAPPGVSVGLAIDGAATERVAHADAQGRFMMPLEGQANGEAVASGQEMAAFLRMPEGHTLQHPLRAPSLRLHAGALEHRLLATAGAALTLTHHPSGTHASHTRPLSVDGAGVATFSLGTPLGAGDRITVTGGASGPTTAVVPRLTARFDRAALRLEGEAPAYRGLVAEIDVAGEALPLRRAAVIGDARRWRLDLALPPGEDALVGPAAAAIDALRVRLRLANRSPGALPGAPHELVLGVPVAGEAGHTALLLPWLGVRRGP